MAQKTLSNVVIQLRNDTATNWSSSTYKLAKGELGYDSTNNVIRIGDGTKTWSQLTNAANIGHIIEAPDVYTQAAGGKDRNNGAIKVDGVNIQTFELTVADTSIIGAVLSTAVEATGDHAGYAQLTTGNYTPGYVTVDTNGRMTVQVVAAAEKLYTPRTITFAESAANAGDTDATGTFTFDGSANITTQLTLVDKFDDDTSKEYYAVTVDGKGRVLSAKEDTEVIATDGASAKLGLVKSAYDDTKAANSDDNQGKVAIDAAGNMTVTKVAEAKKLDALHKITVSGDVNTAEVMTGTGTGFDGSADATLDLSLIDQAGVISSYTKKKIASAANDGSNVLTPLTDADYEVDATAVSQEFAKVTVDKKGRVIAGKRFAKANDIQDFATEVQTVIDSQKTATSAGAADANKLVILNANGKLDDTLIPALGIGQVYTSTDPEILTNTTKKAAFIATNNIQAGDVVVVTADTTGITDPAALGVARANDG